MPASLLKKTCPYCKKSFLTYEKDLNYCSQTCNGKHRYDTLFGIINDVKESNCLFCGESTSRKFCNLKCEQQYGKKKRIENSKNVFMKDKHKNFRPLPYDVLNKIAERKRVFEDGEWLYKNNRERI